MIIRKFLTEKEQLIWVWEQIQQLNLDVGLCQETLDEIQVKIQKKINSPN